jgi:hypothetical protein
MNYNIINVFIHINMKVKKSLISDFLHETLSKESETELIYIRVIQSHHIFRTRL